MACPFFMPLEKFENGAWPHPARLPLGCGWSGHCTAPGHEGHVPELAAQEKFCNLGYAGDCGWIPPDRAWDSVRFAVAPQEKDAPSRAVQLHYVCERDHRPMEHGRLSFDASSGGWSHKHPDNRVQKMAECFLDSWMARRNPQSPDGLAS